MHRTITPRVHGILDYVVVAVFALAPTLLGLVGLAAGLSYLLAVVHLAMTLLTDFPMGAARVIPFHLHGKVEVVVGIALVLLSVTLLRDTAFLFYFVMGLGILATWALTAYDGPTA